MPKVGKYCKAYPVKRLSQFPGWAEYVNYMRKKDWPRAETESEMASALKDDDFLFLQEDFCVTDGIFLDENIVFSQVTPEWMDFCKSALGFEIPDHITPDSGRPREKSDS